MRQTAFQDYDHKTIKPSYQTEELKKTYNGEHMMISNIFVTVRCLSYTTLIPNVTLLYLT